MYWYTLFVKTGKEHHVASQIPLVLGRYNFNPFVPMYDAYFRKGGRIISEKKLCTPGYVFIESSIRGVEFYTLFKPFVVHSQNSFKVLRYGNDILDQSFEMKEEERSILDRLINNERCIEMSQGFIVGNSVTVVEGPLIGLEGFIKKVFRHKMKAIVEFEIMGAKREVTVGLEIASRTP
jgi:transcriptional antiterminator NusG